MNKVILIVCRKNVAITDLLIGYIDKTVSWCLLFLVYNCIGIDDLTLFITIRDTYPTW